jgi:hypothetical protein
MNWIINLFNEALTFSDNIELNDRMISEQEVQRVFKETVVALYNVLSRHYHGGTEQNDDKPHPG